MILLYLRVMAALRDERGSLPEWLPVAMGIVAAIVVIVFVMNYLTGNIGGWIGQIWQDISGHLV